MLFTHTASRLTPEQAEQLAARDIRVVTGQVERLETAGGRLTGVRMNDGCYVACSVLVAGPRMVARSAVLSGLGLRPVPHPLGAEAGQFIESDPTGLTAVPGVWVAGNVTDLQAQVITAAAQGLSAAAAVNWDLVTEETRRAVAIANRAGAAGTADADRGRPDRLHESGAPVRPPAAFSNRRTGRRRARAGRPAPARGR
ncbi:MAG: hypothetical protein ACRDNF_23885 [Streptosporangiaceae bacterium]